MTYRAPGGQSRTAPTAESPKPQRMLSVDALRGSDMFWIAGVIAAMYGLYRKRWFLRV